jgi:hypothetical protein
VRCLSSNVFFAIERDLPSISTRFALGLEARIAGLNQGQRPQTTSNNAAGGPGSGVWYLGLGVDFSFLCFDIDLYPGHILCTETSPAAPPPPSDDLPLRTGPGLSFY